MNTNIKKLIETIISIPLMLVVISYCIAFIDFLFFIPNPKDHHLLQLEVGKPAKIQCNQNSTLEFNLNNKHFYHHKKNQLNCTKLKKEITDKTIHVKHQPKSLSKIIAYTLIPEKTQYSYQPIEINIIELNKIIKITKKEELEKTYQIYKFFTISITAALAFMVTIKLILIKKIKSRDKYLL